MGGRSHLAWLTLLLVVLCSGIIAAGYRYRAQCNSLRSSTESTLSAIADLKVQQLVAWRNERVADAQVLAATPFLQTGEVGQPSRDWLEVFRKHAGYAQVAVLDRTGRILASVSDGDDAPLDRVLALVETALRNGDVSVSDPYRVADGSSYMDIVAPLKPNAPSLVLIHVEATAFLFSFVQQWPAPSTTAESVLVRLEGGEVRYLNQVRHKAGSAAQMTEAFRKDSLAGLAVRGVEGVRVGGDYRNVTVIAALKQVPGTGWALIAKIDKDEMDAPLRQQSRITAILVALLLLACLAAYGFFRKRAQSQALQRQYLAEHQHRILEDRYARLRKHSNDVVLLIDDYGKIVEANDRAVSTYGYSIDELLRLSIVDLLAPSELASFDARWDDLTQQGSHVFEGMHQRKDGSTLPVEVSSRKCEIEGYHYRHSLIRDISERKRAEEQLRRSKLASRVLSDSNQAVIRSGDAAQLLKDICHAITHTGGYPLSWVGFAEETKGQPVRPVAVSGNHPEYVESLDISWDDIPTGRGPVGLAVRTGLPVIFNDVKNEPGFEPWRDRAARFGYHAVVSLPLHGEHGVFGALTIYASELDSFHPEEMKLLEEMAADLSYGLDARKRREQQMRTEAALLDAAAEFRAVFDFANDAIFIVDMEGRFLEANEVACRKLGYTREELVSMTIHDIDSPRFRHEWPKRQAQLAETGEALFENVHVCKDGSEFPVEINNRVFRYGQQTAILGLARDISERKRAEAETKARALELEFAKTEAENANRAKSEFLANMSHEIRTPMNGIIGAAGLLLDTQMSEEQRDYTETIRTSADSLLGIVNDILDLSKIEARKVVIEPAGFDMVACLAETADLLAPSARQKKLDYTFVTETEVRWLWGDSGRIRQIVLNLLNNAIKFTDRGGVTLRFASTPSAGGDCIVKIAIEDTGIGIAEDQIPLLFRKFSQIDASMRKQREGAGLGLAISRELAELMGGDLTVSSVRGAGSTFVLSLPLAPARPPDPVPVTPDDSRELEAATLPRRILLAEDNPVNQKIAVHMLKKIGCAVDVAANGREAVEMAARFPYDLIFMDCGMPEMDGLAASREIRARGPQGPRIPIIALTAHAIAGTREQCLEAGMDDYLSKPVTQPVLQQAVRKWSAHPADMPLAGTTPEPRR